MAWIKGERQEMRGDIEPRSSFVTRNIEWWWLCRKEEKVRRKEYYDRFLKFGDIKTDNTMIVGEVGPGPFGGIIEVCKLPAKNKVFIDYVMEEQHKLNFITWPENALYVDSPAEKIPLPDNSIDVLLSYNTLDHGWNVYDCIKECIRISKRCYLAFDCRGDDEKEVEARKDGHDKDHYQLLKYSDIYTFMCGYPINNYKWVVKDMKIKQFPLAYIEVNKMESGLCSDPM